MAAKKEINADLDITGSIKVSNVPNSIGSLVTYNSSTKLLGMRSSADVLNDLGVTASLNLKADKTTKVVAGTGLTGGGSLASNKTISANFGTTAGTIAQGNDSRINNGQTAFNWGNHALQNYSKQIDIDSSIDAIEIGGRNYALNSESLRIPAYLGASTIYTENITVPEWGATNAVRHQTSGGSSIIKNLITLGTPLQGSKNTMSFYFKNSGTEDLRIVTNIGTNLYVSPNESRLIKIENIPGSGTGQLQIQVRTLLAGGNLDFTIWRLKIEKGNKATDWTPSPEDQIADWNATSGFGVIKNKPLVVSVETDPVYTASIINQVMFKSLIPDGEDLNTYEYTGVYGCNTNAVATSLLNCPSTSAFELTVKRVLSTMIFQELTDHLSNDKWIRNKYSGTTWSPWRLLWSSKNFNPATKEDVFTKNTAFNKNFGTTAGTVAQGNDSRLSDARTPLAHNQAISTITNLQTELNGKLPLLGKDTGSLQVGRTFNNVTSFEVSSTPIEIVIKTKMPYANSSQMPTIHLQGYAYGLSAPIEIKIAYYIYAGNFTSMGAVSLGSWKPQIKLFSYLDGGVRYVAVALIGSIYFPRFSVNLFDLWQGTTRDYSQGWTVDYVTTGSIVGEDNLVTVPYKSTFSQTINGVAFDGTSNITIVDSTKEPVFSKNTAFNKNFGVSANTVAQGNDTRIVNAFNKMINALTITGDTNKTVTLTRQDGTTLIANFSDNNTESPDDVINTMSFNIATGVITAVTSLGSTITTSIDGRFSLLGHTHSLSEIIGLVAALAGKAPLSHVHSAGDITSGIIDYARLPISSTNVADWNTAYGWGTHSGLYSSRALLGGGTNSILVNDTRSTNPEPNTDIKKGVLFDFKSTEAIGLTKASAIYASVMTMVPYGDNSGNINTAFRLAQSANELFFQNWTTAWGTFNKIWSDNDFTSAQITSWNSALQPVALNGYATESWVIDKNYLTSYIDTKYTAGSGLTLSGTVFSLPVTAAGSGNYVSAVVQNTNGITVTKSTLPIPALVTSSTSTGATNVATTNTNTFLNVTQSGASPGSSTQITGAGSVTISSDANGKLTINGVNTNTTYTGSNGINVTGTVITPSYGSSANTVTQGNDSRLSDARTPLAHTHTFASLTSKPTTLAGYGITDGASYYNSVTAAALNSFDITSTNVYARIYYAGAPSPDNGFGTNKWGSALYMGSKSSDYGYGNYIGFDVDGNLYTKLKANDVWGTWKKILTESEINTLVGNPINIEEVTNFNNVTGFKILKSSTSSAQNSPLGTWSNGIQFESAENTQYFNQLIFDIQGRLFTRTKSANVISPYKEVATIETDPGYTILPTPGLNGVSTFTTTKLRFKIHNGFYIIDGEFTCNGLGSSTLLPNSTISANLNRIDTETIETISLEAYISTSSACFSAVKLEKVGEQVFLKASIRQNIAGTTKFRATLPIASVL